MMTATLVLFRATTLAVLAAAASGCATGIPFEKPDAAPEDSAQLYIYRVLRPSGPLPYLASINGADLPISVLNGSWQRLLLPPGNHALIVKDYFGVSYCGPRPLVMQLRPGETTYVRQEVYVTTLVMNIATLGCALKRHPQEAALAEMKNLRRAD
jgi:hypothetical protein